MPATHQHRYAKGIEQMEHKKRIRWPVRWSKTEEKLIEKASRLADYCPTQFIRKASLNKANSLNEKATPEKPLTKEEKLRRKIFDYRVRDGWVEIAEGLQKTAEIIKSSQSEEERLKVIWHELLLWGFCFENLLKGLYSKKQAANMLRDKKAKPLDKDGELSLGKSKHDLEVWCQRADVTNFTTIEQKRILRNLTQIILHHGRYPVSTKWNNSMPVYWELGEYDRILIEMIDLIKNEIGKIDREVA